MRTTVTLDPRAQQILHERMEAKGISFKKALNDAIIDSAENQEEYVFKTPTFSSEILVDLTHVNALLGDLEDEAILQKMRAGK
ncbi:MAG: hypothetical protein FWG08_07475 [Propionibacteriaceae bacterium]|jgi:hypothetical protein|nr:hypothetical protein [Propionibacteriaceae bacterium]